MVTFKVDRVKPAHDLYLEVGPAVEVAQDWMFSRQFYREGKFVRVPTLKVHAAADKELLRECAGNPVLAALGLAYNEHRPLSLSPDAIWLCISQGLGIYINKQPEAFRKHFVDFEGKAKIRVDVAHSDAGRLPWNSILSEFSDTIRSYVGKKRDLFVNDFSTTGEAEKAASEVALMYALKNYFSYDMVTMCGFPEITLEGVPEDWRKIRTRVQAMTEFETSGEGLRWWTDHLLPVIDQLVRTSEGHPDLDFWRSSYREDHGSGGPYITGWINTLMPYLVNNRTAEFSPNKYVHWNGNHGYYKGPTLGGFPRGILGVDVEWDDLGHTRDMEFHGGLIGVSLTGETFRPECGWVIGEKMEEK